MMPDTDAIRLRAYYLFLTREQAGQWGTALDDWLHAEAELVSEGQEPGSPIGEAPKLLPSPAAPITTARAPPSCARSSMRQVSPILRTE